MIIGAVKIEFTKGVVTLDDNEVEFPFNNVLLDDDASGIFFEKFLIIGVSVKVIIAAVRSEFTIDDVPLEDGDEVEFLIDGVFVDDNEVEFPLNDLLLDNDDASDTFFKTFSNVD